MDLVVKCRVADIDAAKEMLRSGAKVGEATISAALFGVQDTGKPVGVDEKQVIDHGAFRSFIDGRDFNEFPVPYFLDHGHAHARGFTDRRLKIGKADTFREEPEELLFRGLYNLDKQVAREEFSDILFDPANSPHSFRWNEDKHYRAEDGLQHVTWIDDLGEVSSVGRGAQMGTGVRGGVMARSMDDLKKWIDEDPEFAKQAAELIRTSASYVADGTEPSPKLRATSLSSLQSQVRQAWYASDAGASAMGPGCGVEDVLVDAGSLTSGQIVCATGDGRYIQYGWTKAADGTISFADSEQTVEPAWATVRSELLEALRVRPEELAVFLRDEKMRAAVDAVMAQVPEKDPVIAWYETLFNARTMELDIKERASGSWNGPAAMAACAKASDPAAAFAAVCAGRRAGDPKLEKTWALPHHDRPGAPANERGVSSALGRFDQTQGLINAGTAKAHLLSHQASFKKSSAA